MIYEDLNTNSTHINTVLHKHKIHFKNLTENAYTMVYKIKLINTNKVKLINFFEEPMFDMVDGKKQSFVVDWGDGCSTKVFTENINTKIYNSSSSLILEHDYIDTPLNQEIEIVIMSEYETLCPIAFDESIDGIEIVKMAGIFAPINKDINTMLRAHIRRKLKEIYSLKELVGGSMFKHYGRGTLVNIFAELPELTDITNNIFDDGCENITDITQLFYNNSKMLVIPNFTGFTKVETADSFCSGCSAINYVSDIFSHLPLKNINNGFKNCSTLIRVDSANFNGKTDLNALGIFDGCFDYITAMTDRVFDHTTFKDSKYGGIVASFANIPDLVITDEIVEGEEPKPHITTTFRGYKYYDRMFMNSATNRPFELLFLDNLNVTTADAMFSTEINSDDVYQSLPNRKVTITGPESSIVDMYKNRHLEIFRYPFVFNNVTNLDYSGCFVGNKSLYNNQQIFGNLYREGMKSGVTPITATVVYEVELLRSDIDLKFSTVYNKYNPDMNPELDASIEITIGNGTTIINKAELESMKTGLGFKNIRYTGVTGTKTITVKYTHCAPMTLTYEKTVDYTNYRIISANIELFPTDTSYIGKYGLELWSAETITGDFFRIFYDRPNVTPQTWTDPNIWFNNMFAFFSPKVKTVNKDIFKSIGFVGNITEINDIFRYEYRTDNGRDLFNNFTFGVGLNPFKTFDGTIFRFTPNVTKVRTWFNDSVNNTLINISGVSLNNLFGSLTKLVTIDRVLHSCELIISVNVNRILWTNNNLVEEVSSYIGRVNYLAKDLLMKPKLKKVYRFHVLHMVNGKDKEDLADCYMDFSNSNNDIDLTEMFYDEKFEIPDGFIRNVKGTLKFNNCFKGSYRFDIANDNSLFTNVVNKTAGHVSGMEFISLTEPLSMEFSGYDTGTGTIGLKLKDKNGSNHRVVTRLYSKETGRYKLLCTKHVVVSDVDVIPNLTLKTGTTGVKLELWCTTANIYLENLSKMRVKNLSGSYGRTQWINRVRMQDVYPGLVPSNIICTDAGGPWKNITPTNGTIDFTEMFTGITNKELIDYRILKTNSPAKTTYNMTGAFKNGSIADFDIRMFEFIGDMLINGYELFTENSDENFTFVNLNSGPFIFMELLFTKFTTATNMFRRAATPKNLFNNAPFFGCDRNGEIVETERHTLTNIRAFLSRHDDSTGNSNKTPNEYLPEWNKNIIYKLTNIDDLIIASSYKLDPEKDHSILPNTEAALSAWASYNTNIPVFNFRSKINLHKIILLGRAMAHRDSRYMFLLDYHIFSTDLTNDTVIIHSLFNGVILDKTDPNFKFLIEPFDNTFGSVDLTTTHVNGAVVSPFNCFQTYAPDNVLFRNVKSFTGTSGAELLTYPNFIEYQNIHLTGNQVTFIREELAEAHRFSTYLTVHIKYSDTYEEAKWFIVDKNADSYTIDLETSKIVNNTVSIKIQSTQCFYLMKTNVDYVEKLEGTYRKDLQPRDSEFFNFDVDYYYFIERFGADLWKDVKIKQGDKFRFGKNDNDVNKLKTIDGSPFRTQAHITAINMLFRGCGSFIPQSTLFIGLSAVTSSYLLFTDVSAIENIPLDILKPLINTRDLGDIFANIGVLNSIPSQLLKFNTELIYLNNMFLSNRLNHSLILQPEFWNSISESAWRFTSMFGNVKGIGRERNTQDAQFITDNSFRFKPQTVTSSMFHNTNLLDVRISWIKEGRLESANSINMFNSCYTYEERTAFEARYGNQTGVNFKCHEPCIYKSSLVNLSGRFIPLYSEPTLDKNTEYVKVVVDSGVYYKTLTELESTGITVTTSKVEVYSDYPIIFECTNVERLEGKFPTNNGSIFDLGNFNLGQKYPNLKYIDPLFFSKLTNASDMSYVFRDLRDINIIPANLFTPMVNLRSLNGTYSNAKGTLNNLSDITNFIGPSTNINSMDSLFKNVSIKQIGRKAIKLRNSGTVNLTDAFSGTNAYIDADTFEGSPSSINITGMFRTCKSLYSIDELTNLSKTGDSLLEVLKSFKPLIGLSETNSEINLMVLHDTPDANKIVDVLVDWGDGNSNIMVGVRTDSITHISKVIASSGDKTLRIWCSYYGVGVKLKADSTGSIVKHAGGYVGKFIGTIDGFIARTLPNATSIDSTVFHSLSENRLSKVFSHSNIVQIPSSICAIQNIPELPSFVWGLFENADKVTSIDKDALVDFKTSSNQTDISVAYLFKRSSSLVSIPVDILKPLLNLNIVEVDQLFHGSSSVTHVPDIFKHHTLNKFKNTEYSLRAMFYEMINLKSVEWSILDKFNGKTSEIQQMFLKTNPEIIHARTPLLRKELFKPGLVNALESFKTTILDTRIDNIVIENTPTSTFNVTNAMLNIRSLYTESEIFGDNTLVGSSGLTTDPRTVMKMTVSAGTLNLLAFTNSDYTSKLLIKKNGKVESLNPYANKSLTVADNDIIEVITFNNIKDAYVTVDLNTSTSKVKHLDGILNIGPKSIVNGKFNKTIAEAFGTDIITMSDTFLTQFNTVTSVSNLCKALINLTSIPNRLLTPLVEVTNYSSMFENCYALQLTNDNSDMFIVANKGITFDFMFKNCTGITYIPPRFFKGCTQLDKTFDGTFTNTRVTVIPDDIDEF
ncbi:MAG: hypothetical protein ACRCX8_05505 [Sarcina sp.]